MKLDTPFARLHHGERLLVLPNAWDVASALLLQDAGFPAIGTTSLGVTAAAGLRDGAGEGKALTVDLVRTLAPRLEVPLTADLEGGYSDEPAEVAALVSQLADLGVAGVNLEDSHADGTLRDAGHHAEVVAAAVEAAPSVFVNARTDVHWLAIGEPEGRLAEAVGRLRRYATAGASGVFAPKATDPSDVRVLAEATELPLNVLWQPGADVEALAALGVSRVSTGSALYRHALAAAVAQADEARGAAVAGEVTATGYAHLQELLG
jgi:2-methylisocitrate lyase-like PEP mutase family enzyme